MLSLSPVTLHDQLPYLIAIGGRHRPKHPGSQKKVRRREGGSTGSQHLKLVVHLEARVLERLLHHRVLVSRQVLPASHSSPYTTTRPSGLPRHFPWADRPSWSALGTAFGRTRCIHPQHRNQNPCQTTGDKQRLTMLFKFMSWVYLVEEPLIELHVLPTWLFTRKSARSNKRCHKQEDSQQHKKMGARHCMRTDVNYPS